MSKTTNEDIMRAIGILEGTTNGIHELLEKQDKRLNSHGSRLRKVEGRQLWFVGVAATCGVILTGAAKKLGLM